MNRTLFSALRSYRSFSAKRNFSSKDLAARELLDKLYASIRAHKFENIVVIQTKFNADPRYYILADAFNSRHLVNGTNSVNKEYKNSIKSSDQEFAKLGIASEWNVLDFESIVVHLFSHKCRQHYDIEQLWAVGEKYDDLTNFSDEINASSQNQALLEYT